MQSADQAVEIREYCGLAELVHSRYSEVTGLKSLLLIKRSPVPGISEMLSQ
jgi:hypothetical protein